MNQNYVSIVGLLTAATIIGMVMTTFEQGYAPKMCPGCLQFKKLTHEFEKSVIEAETIGDPNTIPALLEQYNEDVRALDLSTLRE